MEGAWSGVGGQGSGVRRQGTGIRGQGTGGHGWTTRGGWEWPIEGCRRLGQNSEARTPIRGATHPTFAAAQALPTELNWPASHKSNLVHPDLTLTLIPA